MGGVGIKPTGEEGEHSVLFNDLIRVKKEVNLKSEWVLIPLFVCCAATSRS